MPVDVPGALLAILILLSGTLVFCVSLALAARVVDRVWDLVSPPGEDHVPRRRAGGTNVRRRMPARTVLVTVLAAALVAALAWLAVVSRRDPGRLPVVTVSAPLVSSRSAARPPRRIRLEA